MTLQPLATPHLACFASALPCLQCLPWFNLFILFSRNSPRLSGEILFVFDDFVLLLQQAALQDFAGLSVIRLPDDLGFAVPQAVADFQQRVPRHVRAAVAGAGFAR